MDQTAIDRLTALSRANKPQKSKLSKPEVEEAATLLAQGLLASLGPSYDTIDTFIRTLPVDATAKALRDSWGRLADQTRSHLFKSLLDLPRTDRFDRLKLLAAAAIADTDAQRGLSFLCTVCGSLESRPGGQVNADVLQVFRKTFLGRPTPRLENLDITLHPSAVTTGLLNITMQSLFHDSAQVPAPAPVFQLSTVKWLFRTLGYNRLKPVHQTQLVEAIKRWDTTLQLELRDSVTSLSSGLPSGLEFLLTPPASKGTSLPHPVSHPIQPAPVTVQPEKQTLHWNDLLAELQKQLSKLDNDLLVANEKSATTQDENQKLKASVEKAAVNIQSLRDELAKMTAENDNITTALSIAKGKAGEAEQHAEMLAAQIGELKRKHNEEITVLTSRVETEAAQRVESFKHSLARVLRVDYADFKLNEGKPMTIELGHGLYHLLASIFDGLQKSGINAKD